MLKKLLHVFSKEYKEEMQYLDLCENMKTKIHLNTATTNITEKIQSFSNIDSDCHITINRA